MTSNAVGSNVRDVCRNSTEYTDIFRPIAVDLDVEQGSKKLTCFLCGKRAYCNSGNLFIRVGPVNIGEVLAEHVKLKQLKQNRKATERYKLVKGKKQR